MSAPRGVPLDSPLGPLRGRTAVFLGHVDYTHPSTVLVEGTLHKADPLRYFPFRLRFDGMLQLTVTELDEWLESTPYDCEDMRVFFEVVHSPWLSRFAGKLSPDHRHFVLVTYDDVIEVVSTGYEWSVPDLDPPQEPYA